MNKITIFGRIGRKIELKKTNSGKSVCSFSVATTEKYSGKESTEWHNVVAWEGKAETLANYFCKGDRILLNGKMTYRQYGEEGNKKTTAEIVLQDFSFIESAKSRQQDQQQPAQQPSQNGFGDQEELPF